MLLAFLIAIPIAALAFSVGSLTLSGAVAAAIVGALCILAGWGWAGLLILYFVVAVAFSKLGADAKSRRTDGVVAKAGRRDAVQVLANGGVFARAVLRRGRRRPRGLGGRHAGHGDRHVHRRRAALGDHLARRAHGDVGRRER